MSKGEIAKQNREQGKSFEQVFETQCRFSCLLPLKNPLSAKFIGKGQMILEKADLDYRVIRRDGRIAFIDCKSFAEDRFKYSEIDKAQLERSVLYREWNIQAGFVVWHRSNHKVVFYNGSVLFQAGPGSSFGPEVGLTLGTLQTFKPKLIYEGK